MSLRVYINDKVKKFFRKKRFVFFKKSEGILIFDDVIPSNLSPWRSHEFNHLLKSFPKSFVLADLRNYNEYNQNNSFNENLSNLEKRYLYFKGKVKRIDFINLIFGRIGYTIFFFNIDKYFELFEKKKIPFVFTLYPGGGFLLNNEFVNERLSVICKSKNFHGVIVNQFFVRDYLVNSGICDTKKINLIHGVPIDINSYNKSLNLNRSTDKGLRILFFANKYKTGSTDKGWGLFLELSKKLIEK